jgi:hypothetical protein
MENENTVLDNSSGPAPVTPQIAQASHTLSHKPLRAEVTDLQQAADVIRERLEPKPPNIVQKVLRLAAVPLGLASGYAWGRNHAWEGLLKFMDQKEKLNDPLLHIKDADEFDAKRPGMSDSEKMGTYLAEHEAIKTDRAKNFLKLAPKREKVTWKVKWLNEEEIKGLPEAEKAAKIAAKEAEIEAARQATLAAIKAEKSLPFLEKLKLIGQREKNLLKFTTKDHTRAAGLVFQSLFAGGAALGLTLTVSDNKNFLNFFNGKDKKSGTGNSVDQKHSSWKERRNAESGVAQSGVAASLGGGMG